MKSLADKKFEDNFSKIMMPLVKFLYINPEIERQDNKLSFSDTQTLYLS